MFELDKRGDSHGSMYLIWDNEAKSYVDMKLPDDEAEAEKILDVLNELKTDALKKYYLGQFKILFEQSKLYDTLMWADLRDHLMRGEIDKIYLDSRVDFKNRRKFATILTECYIDIMLKEREKEYERDSIHR